MMLRRETGGSIIATRTPETARGGGRPGGLEERPLRLNGVITRKRAREVFDQQRELREVEGRVHLLPVEPPDCASRLTWASDVAKCAATSGE